MNLVFARKLKTVYHIRIDIPYLEKRTFQNCMSPVHALISPWQTTRRLLDAQIVRLFLQEKGLKLTKTIEANLFTQNRRKPKLSNTFLYWIAHSSRCSKNFSLLLSGKCLLGALATSTSTRFVNAKRMLYACTIPYHTYWREKVVAVGHLSTKFWRNLVVLTTTFKIKNFFYVYLQICGLYSRCK